LKNTFSKDVYKECNDIAKLLIQKNKAYGNSALNPVRIFSHANTLEQLKVRIDDKLSRIARGYPEKEEVIKDLIGYLILLLIGEKYEKTIKRH